MPKRAREASASNAVASTSTLAAGSAHPAVPAALPALQQAVWTDRSVAIDPFGLVSKAGVRYLVALDREMVKTFRVQRIDRVRLLERHFKRPSTFDVGDYWKSRSTFPATDEPPFATFRMNRTALASASTYLNVESKTRAREGPGGDRLVRIAFPSIELAL